MTLFNINLTNNLQLFFADGFRHEITCLPSYSQSGNNLIIALLLIFVLKKQAENDQIKFQEGIELQKTRPKKPGTVSYLRLYLTTTASVLAASRVTCLSE